MKEERKKSNIEKDHVSKYRMVVLTKLYLQAAIPVASFVNDICYFSHLNFFF
jgi:hypothetical protein